MEGMLSEATPHSTTRTAAVVFAGFCAFVTLFAPQPLLPLLAREFRVSAAAISLVLWILAKPQNAPMGLLLGLFTFRLAMWTESKPARVVAAVGSCAMFACAAFNVLAMPIYGRQANIQR